MDVSGYALITGGASGIGKACAKAFALEGCAGIALLDVDTEALGEAKMEVEGCLEPGARREQCPILIHNVDVSDETQVNKIVEEVAQTFGRIDYVVNAAGIALKHVGGTAFAKTVDWSRTVNINLTGTFFVLRAAANVMLRQRPIMSDIDGRPLQRGSIINFASIQGVVGIELSAAYTATKHAVIGLTRTASLDFAEEGLRVNAICPGYTETPMTTRSPEVLKAMEERVGTAVPMRRMGDPKEIADGVLYLAGGRSSFVTGSALMVDGGYTSR
ncbi:short-chain dehydrogenase reductase family [Purpureocillium lilacinum]|uniref:Short-chain dehydrogenase reductase family n=1 Tax=Purpureocillium lilacinum TaxID=33203 RepID=A0A179EW91_PURLI|nr:short-chain dehydrogenase reductase family [Purpureocillium lilacinum]KAK4078816.1 hypothetical protein Purlil1_11892 [Purpureocillium lilacinum]OAQ57290.1 short-chain dehydrogenase reductase family [Purpureocillium lilacinum]PWI66908.1 hypothetical protein PCL_04414 [Purpureocillium lilacinum]